MLFLPFLVSIVTFNKRKEYRDAQNVDDNVRSASEDDNAIHRIDIHESETRNDDSSLPSLYRPRGRPLRQCATTPTRPFCLCFAGRRTSISITTVAVVKKPYTLSRRILHAVHRFIFQPDKKLEESYSPKYRYLPIISGLVVPVSSRSYYLSNHGHSPVAAPCIVFYSIGGTRSHGQWRPAFPIRAHTNPVSLGTCQ
jgi:hypothetical protein